jgi:hypothetical protein
MEHCSEYDSAVELCIPVLLMLYSLIDAVPSIFIGEAVYNGNSQEAGFAQIIIAIVLLLISLFISYKIYKFLISRWSK